MIETTRLILRHWQNSDAKELLSWQRSCYRPKSRLVAASICGRKRNNYYGCFNTNETTYAICLKDGMPIGSIGIMPISKEFMLPPAVEVGYWIGKAYWGQGYTVEALTAILADQFARNRS